MITQVLSQRYIDKQKLAAFWRTHPDFKGRACSLTATLDSYIIQVPRKMNKDEVEAVWYDEEILKKIRAADESQL